MYRIKIIKSLSLLLLLSLCISMLFSCSSLRFKVEFIVDEEVYKTVSTRDKSEIKVPKNPEKEGYEFKGWYLKNGDSFTANSLLDTPISDDMVLKVYARFIPVTEEAENFLFRACDGGYEVIGYTGGDPVVTIPSTYQSLPVLAISRDYNNPNCFAKNENIEEIIIPNSVTRISYSAFEECINLKKLTIPDSVTDIDYVSFYGCENLTDVTLPASLVKYIKKTNLTTVVINAGTSIPESFDGFHGCKNLISVTIADSVTSIGYAAFEGCENLTTIRLPNSLTEISEYAFNECKSLNNVIIPEGVSSIGRYAFEDCSSLTSLTFQNPDGWQVTNGSAIASSILSNPASAAEYFSETWGESFHRK